MVPESGYLTPIELTTYWLKFSARLTHKQVSIKFWTSSNAQEYLSHCCISTKIAYKIIDHALNVRLLEEMEEEMIHLCCQYQRKTETNIQKNTNQQTFLHFGPPFNPCPSIQNH